ncbi:hypothetical protein DLR66_06755 [Vibrio paracholerae]|uniref:Uncharacterized protein n=1 Tax=Vibrio paracholerae TaxID=650003 RepID=A0AAX1QSR5_9VIBR|nr:hypothetical protein DB317_07545 [Vibrio cholerae]RBM45638.1 hypothetical protein DLR66_06755 [Vibrio paracholerae]RBM53132.1 hypothetical protein DLR69_14025 [Vibrio paracholerae]RBM59264.1 hypothetical protein DLR67_11900 [Vibrio paracholerae]RBM62625.1 hypothetical protein DLR71_09420 [Vibrio paracholerae]
MHIPFLPEAAAVSATFVHPNHSVYLCSLGFTLLPPTCNAKPFGSYLVSRRLFFESNILNIPYNKYLKFEYFLLNHWLFLWIIVLSLTRYE